VNRRQALRGLGAAGAASAIGGLTSRWASGQTTSRYNVLGSGPTVIAFDRPPAGYFEALSRRYRVVVMDYPPSDLPPAAAESFTAERVCADILAVADAVSAPRFAWYGFSWGAVVGLQLAVRTNRLTALACGGWPPLGGQYEAALAAAESAPPAGRHFATYYQSLRGWREREAVSQLTCPRLAFAGTNDRFTAAGHNVRIGPLVAEHREELERLGWTVRMVDGFGHELGGRPDVITPILREFFDSHLTR
jgi:pimeloyl-ACP methyl ester carboxylesterase